MSVLEEWYLDCRLGCDVILLRKTVCVLLTGSSCLAGCGGCGVSAGVTVGSEEGIGKLLIL